VVSTEFGICPLCEAMCGIAVEKDGERIVKIRGDDQDVLSRGYICPKATALVDVQDDPDRIKTPLLREGDTWREIGWEEALSEIAARIHAIQSAHGRDSAALYVGNPTAHDYAAMLFGLLFAGVLKSKSFFSSNTTDGQPRLLASLLLYGNPLMVPVPDLDRTDHLLVIGGNPIVSNGSLCTAPDMKARLSALRARGGKLVVIDPRRTETAELADLHHFIRPGTDALLLAAMLNTLFERPVELPSLYDGIAELKVAIAPFTPERAAPVVGIDASQIRNLALELQAAKSAAVYGRLGTCTQEFGTLSSWLIDVLNAVTHNLDREGGAMFTTPAFDVASGAARFGRAAGAIGYNRWRSRVSGLPEVNGEIPVVALAEEIETPGEGQIRCLITHAGNPVLSVPNGRRLERALESLELMVAIDLYKNETTRHAHLILPTSFGLEHAHYAALSHLFAVRNTAKWAPALVAPPSGVRHSYQIMIELATRLLKERGLPGSAISGVMRATLNAIGPRGTLDLALRFGPHGKGLFGRGLSLSELERAPHGIDLGPLEPRLVELMAGRRVQLAPQELIADLRRLDARIDELTSAPASLTLIGRRHLRSNNSWMHNSLRLVKGKDRCTLLMHPRDAQVRGLTVNDRVKIASSVGAVVAPLELTEEMMPGVVSLPHGFGHHGEGVDLSVARAHAGVSINDVIDDRTIDKPSGTSGLNSATVTVSRAG
jgi:anaerobic selenocysteine-containing dehydrogenase